EIAFLGPQPGMLGRTGPAQHRIEIFVRPDESVAVLAHVVAHEIGHAVDKTFSDDRRHAMWLQIKGIDARNGWFTCSMCDDFATPAGDFAETFAFWQLRDFDRSQLAPAPSTAQLAQLAPLFNP